jgi:hypothetical protein
MTSFILMRSSYKNLLLQMREWLNRIRAADTINIYLA